MTRTLLLAAALLLTLAAAAGAGTSITLRPAASAAPGTPILLRDIADLTGDDAARLGATPILTADEARTLARAGRLSIDLPTVRAALEREAAGVNWGRTTLSGGTADVRIAEAPAPAATTPAPVPASRPSEPTHETVDVSGAAEPTVRTHIAARLAHLFGVAPADLRLKFRAEDAPLLDTRTRDRRVDVQPAASAASGRVPLRIYIYAGDRIALSGGATVEALIRRDVLAAVAPIERGELITHDRITASSRWISPDDRPPATLEQLAASGAGAEARARIAAGAVIAAEDIQPPLAARRGDIVTVHCLSGGVTVRVRARALADIRDGETGAFRTEAADGSRRSSRDRKTFTARMDGPGRAVVVAPATVSAPESPQ